MDIKSREPDRPASLTGRTDKVLIGSILLGALLYRLYAFTGDISYDPLVYAQNAYNLLNGTFRFDTLSMYDHRFTVFVPVALAYALLGVGTLSTHLWPLFLSLLQIVAVLWLGYRWLGREAAILGVLLLALFPLDVVYAGILTPDVVIACFVTCSVVSWIGAFEGREKPSRILPFVAGLFCGLAVLTRPYAIVMLLFFAGDAIWRRASLRHLLRLCLGLASVGVPILLLYAIVTGDPLYSLRSVSELCDVPPPEGARLLFYPLVICNPKGPAGLFGVLFAAAAVVGLIKPTRRRLVLLLWILPMLIYLQFGTQSWRSYVPVTKSVRYLTPLLAPAALLAALVILEELPRIVRRTGRLFRFSDANRVSRILLVCLVLLLSASSFAYVRSYRRIHLGVTNSFRNVVALVRSEEGIPVLIDHWRTGIRLSYYFGFKEGSHFYIGADETQRMKKTRVFENSRLGYPKWYENPHDLPEAFIVLEDDILAAARQAAAADPSRSTFPAKDIPEYCQNPPASWQFLGRFGSLRVFRTSKKDSSVSAH